MAILAFDIKEKPSGAAPPVAGGKGSGRITTFASLSAGLADTVASRISYQGRQTDAAGNPSSSNYDMTFQIWDAETGGQQLGDDNVVGGVVRLVAIF